MKSFGIVEKLGGRAKVVKVLALADQEITLDGVRMWSKRGQIPGAAVRILMAEAERRRMRIRSTDLILIEV